MSLGRRRFLAAAGVVAAAPTLTLAAPAGASQVPILAYHRFADVRNDSMTVRTGTFEAHLRMLQSLGAQCVPLSALVDAWRGVGAALPERAVVLTADDGHRSQYEVMAPRLAARGLHATLFIYPSAISNADYAMRWSQLRALRDQGLDIGSHTYWHPNLVRERRQTDEASFQRAATYQLQHSKARLEQELQRPVSLLAWPFGLTDDGLDALAHEAGYEAAVVLGNRSARREDKLYELPRHLITDDVSADALAQRLLAAWEHGHVTA